MWRGDGQCSTPLEAAPEADGESEEGPSCTTWKCGYLGYGMNWRPRPRLRVATMSLGRLRNRLPELLRGARGYEHLCANKPCALRLGELLRALSDQAAA
jgi:hypothetical protein